MKSSGGFVLAALAVTVAHGGNPNYLRSSDSNGLANDDLDHLLDAPTGDDGVNAFDEDEGFSYADKTLPGYDEYNGNGVIDIGRGNHENVDMTVQGGKDKPMSDVMLLDNPSEKMDIEGPAVTDSVSPLMYSKGGPVIFGKESFLTMEDDSSPATVSTKTDNMGGTLKDEANNPFQIDNVPVEPTTNGDDDSLATKMTKLDDNDAENMTDDEANNPFQMDDDPVESTTNGGDNSLATKTTKLDDNDVENMTDDEANNPFQMEDVLEEPASHISMNPPPAISFLDVLNFLYRPHNSDKSSHTGSLIYNDLSTETAKTGNDFNDKSMTDDEANNPFQMDDDPVESTINGDDVSLATKTTKLDDIDVKSMTDDEANNLFQMDDVPVAKGLMDPPPSSLNSAKLTLLKGVPDLDGSSDAEFLVNNEGNYLATKSTKTNDDYDMTDDTPDVDDSIIAKDVAIKGRISPSSMNVDIPSQF